jgi:hypothetical protein
VHDHDSFDAVPAIGLQTAGDHVCLNASPPVTGARRRVKRYWAARAAEAAETRDDLLSKLSELGSAMVDRRR